jgi:hypothetical protein
MPSARRSPEGCARPVADEELESTLTSVRDRVGVAVKKGALDVRRDEAPGAAGARAAAARKVLALVHSGRHVAESRVHVDRFARDAARQVR